MRSRESQRPLTFWDIALAVTIGSLAASAIETLVTAAWVRIEFHSAIEQLRHSTEASNQQQQAQQLERDAQERQRREAEEEARNQQELAEAKAASEKAKKDQAWANYYKPPTVCANPPNDTVAMNCANEHLRAKTQFEATYRP